MGAHKDILKPELIKIKFETHSSFVIQSNPIAEVADYGQENKQIFKEN